MGHNDHIDFQFHDAIEDLVDEGLIEDRSKEYGVAQQVIHSGYDSLSIKQRVLYNAVIVPALTERANEIRVSEIVSSMPE